MSPWLVKGQSGPFYCLENLVLWAMSQRFGYAHKTVMQVTIGHLGDPTRIGFGDQSGPTLLSGILWKTFSGVLKNGGIASLCQF
ncbi:MAG: hypothetical protein JEZ11_23170 [Desulfobacterales bacterium]|nr:hypothetical protein [Desulfobacterales bacterium]